MRRTSCKVSAVTLQSSKLIADLQPLTGSASPFLRRRAAGLFPSFLSWMVAFAITSCLFAMLEKQNAERVGNYVVTPLTKTTNVGVTASVSIRRGMYDRIFRFLPSFPCDAQAVQYAMAQGRRMVLHNQLG
ncbi:hypothetical protein [Diaphorobacter nitroreducens]|uniref:hypothetical protein n=1 Tax=Diaphorobacter nitroreducens TaxID=164759 RepID=UPI0035E45436